MESVPFLIIGQGLAGTMLAFEMLRSGLNFKIASSAERSRASTVAAGMFNPLVFKRLTKSWMIDELLPVMDVVYPELETTLGCKFYFKKNILKPLSEQEMGEWRQKQELLANYILKTVESSPVDGIKNAAGYGVVLNSGFLDLNSFLESSRKFFTERGFHIDLLIDYSDFSVVDGQLQHDQIKAETIIFCEGAHVTQNPFFSFLKMKPTKGELLLVDAADLSDDFIINKDLFVIPVGNHQFKVGSTYEWDDLTESPTEKGRQSIIERFEKLVTVDYTVKNHWAGIRPTIHDRHPVLGFHPEYKNVAVFNGLGTKGVMLAPYFSREMTKLLTDKQFQINREVRLDRFF